MVKLSVIVPCYNAQQYIVECLDSLVEQTYKDMEIICVNDGSTDGTLKVLKKYAAKHAHLKIIDKKIGGPSSARNAGMDAASGEYFAFVDGDDFMEPTAYEEAMQHINEADFVHFGVRVVGDGNMEYRASDNNYYSIKYQGVTPLSYKVVLNSDVSPCNKIYKKAIITQNQLRFPNGFYYEDAEFYFKYISCASTCYFLDKYFYNYRRSGTSIMSETFSGTDKAIDHLHIVDHIFDFWLQNGYLKKHEKLFLEIFRSYFNLALCHTPQRSKSKVLTTASEYAAKFSKKMKKRGNFIKKLKKRRYGDIFEPDLKWYQKIHKKITYYNVIEDCRQQITYFLGFRRKKYPEIEIIRKLNIIETRLWRIEEKLGIKE